MKTTYRLQDERVYDVFRFGDSYTTIVPIDHYTFTASLPDFFILPL